MKNIIELSEQSFDREVLGAALPVVVDFYAPWCGPCKMLAPLIEQVAGEFQGRILFGKLNVDDAPQLAGTLQITGVPTLMLFRGGQLVDTKVGLLPPRALKAWLEQAAPANAEAATA
jgi:thioredoxin